MNENELKKKLEGGMYISDRCQFCHDFEEKVKPWICKDCWDQIKEVVCEYKDEFFPVKAISGEPPPCPKPWPIR